MYKSSTLKEDTGYGFCVADSINPNDKLWQLDVFELEHIVNDIELHVIVNKWYILWLIISVSSNLKEFKEKSIWFLCSNKSMLLLMISFVGIWGMLFTNVGSTSILWLLLIGLVCWGAIDAMFWLIDVMRLFT